MTSLLHKFERYCEFKTRVCWRNVFAMLVLHACAVYGLMLFPSMKLISIAFACLFGLAADTAVSAGAHRLWSHKTYKARLPMRIIVMLCYMLSGQYSIVSWARDHRVHHKYTDTDADPYSSARGLFYSHCGWLLMFRHPDFRDKRKVMDVSDLWEDPVIRFHQKYYTPLLLAVHVIFPSAFAYYVLGETWQIAVFSMFFCRYAVSVNLIFCINSLAHYWGYKPYNNKITATSHAFVSFLTFGEGWHNFHHTFPWDYRNGERGQSWQFPAYVIEWFAWLGLAYDLKTASPDLIQKVLDKQDLPKNFEVPENGLPEDAGKPKMI